MKRTGILLGLCMVATLAGANAKKNLDGVWATDGYGWLIEIKGNDAQIFQKSGMLCLKEHPTPAPLDTLLPGASFELHDDGTLLSLSMSPVEPTLTYAQRLTALPQMCDETVIDSAINNFTAFSTFFAEHYAFFDTYGVDWDATVSATRPAIEDGMDDQELFFHLTNMIEPMKDAHVSLTANIGGEMVRHMGNRGRTSTVVREAAIAVGNSPGQASRSFQEAFWYGSVGNDLLQAEGEMMANDLIQYGMLGDSVGYLALAAIGGFVDDDLNEVEALRQTQNMLDSIIGYFEGKGAQRLIIDLSFNLGGDDHIAREIASRFVREPIQGYSKYAADAVTRRTTSFTITPSERAVFNGDVILVTSNVTVSAAEVLAMVLKNQPHVTHIGEPTRGAFSDILSRTLPNGWILNLSNEVYLDQNGDGWEGVGLQPSIDHLVFADVAPIESHAVLVRGLAGNLQND